MTYLPDMYIDAQFKIQGKHTASKMHQTIELMPLKKEANEPKCSKLQC